MITSRQDDQRLDEILALHAATGGEAWPEMANELVEITNRNFARMDKKLAYLRIATYAICVIAILIGGNVIGLY